MYESKKTGALTETTLYTLLALYKPKHGYAIMQFIETNRGVGIGAGTLYGGIKTLLKNKWIINIETDIKDTRRTKEYLITDLGKEVVQKEVIRLKKIYKLASQISTEGLK
ncbi:PadR family transcriptional regulator [Clostridiaceae bacterium M8S5]|nr:PadR family transcriptional regulator [Clostridiaceae bacterium M8S5]